jgi:hypothetical protein
MGNGAEACIAEPKTIAARGYLAGDLLQSIGREKVVCEEFC